MYIYIYIHTYIHIHTLYIDPKLTSGSSDMPSHTPQALLKSSSRRPQIYFIVS